MSRLAQSADKPFPTSSASKTEMRHRTPAPAKSARLSKLPASSQPPRSQQNRSLDLAPPRTRRMCRDPLSRALAHRLEPALAALCTTDFAAFATQFLHPLF